ncbi:MAG: hypothetical protein AB1486_18775 [Planctomycetota bacterium]
MTPHFGVSQVLVAALVLVPQGTGTATKETPPAKAGEDPLERAVRAFEKAPLDRRRELVARMAERIEADPDPELRRLLALRDRARGALDVVPKPAPGYYDPEKWAPGLYERRLLAPTDSRVQTKVDLFRPWESRPPLAARIEYDFATDLAHDSRVDPPPEEKLSDFLNGYPPGADLLLAWLERLWDFDEGMEPLARHFGHVYCDLQGNAYPGITIYDALASREGMDMPDVDVIPYARQILEDHSYVSPIPADTRRARLYKEIEKGFLKYFRYRTWIEAAANLYLDPEVELRPEHEPLRKRLLYVFALTAGDVDAIRARLEAAQDRQEFVLAVDGLAFDDLLWEKKGQEFAAKVSGARWSVALAAHAVLREAGLLTDGSSPERVSTPASRDGLEGSPVR